MPKGLTPLVRTDDRASFAAVAAEAAAASVRDDGVSAESPPVHLRGFCLVCNALSTFVLDYRAGGAPDTGPNWREDLICRRCHMSNRQRLLAHLAAVEAAGRRQPALYLMEETTPLYRWFRRQFGQVRGSEYIYAACEPGQRVLPWQLNSGINRAQPLRSLYHFANLTLRALLLGGIHHEDVTRLSFPADSFDAIVSGDVFEHVPEPAKAFEECARVLKPDGVLLATLPVNWLRDDSVTRARLGIDGALSLATTPVYHGNPLSDEGSLVFTDFGWDVLSSMAGAGLRNVSMALYRAPECGHPGPGIAVIRAEG